MGRNVANTRPPRRHPACVHPLLMRTMGWVCLAAALLGSACHSDAVIKAVLSPPPRVPGTQSAVDKIRIRFGIRPANPHFKDLLRPLAILDHLKRQIAAKIQQRIRKQLEISFGGIDATVPR